MSSRPFKIKEKVFVFGILNQSILVLYQQKYLSNLQNTVFYSFQLICSIDFGTDSEKLRYVKLLN